MEPHPSKYRMDQNYFQIRFVLQINIYIFAPINSQKIPNQIIHMKKILFLFLSLLVCACSEQTENVTPQAETFDLHQRSREEALRIAASVFKNTTHSTRSVCAATLSVEPMLNKRHRTRISGVHEVDTTYFIINNGDNQGFAFISGDKRQTPLLAFSDSGNLHSKDFEENPGLSIFKEQCENARVMISGGDNNDKPSQNQDGKPIYKYTTYRALETHIFKKGYVIWGQQSPYNDQAPTYDGQKCPAGCIPTAVCQLLAYYQHPKAINGYSIDWDLLVYLRSKSIKPIDISSHYRKGIATLFHQVGKVVEADYGVKGTSANHWAIKENLEKIGYKETLKHYPADSSSVIRDILPTIQKGHPALVMGYLKDGSAGHMWLADGWGKFVEATIYSNEPDTEYWSKKSMDNIYLHMNWGWSGQDNGFFLAGSYKVNDPKAIYGKYDHVSTRDYDLCKSVSFSIFTPQQ